MSLAYTSNRRRQQYAKGQLFQIFFLGKMDRPFLKCWLNENKMT
jgi:hypothetical protein